jgi:hypothetical protein
MWNITKQNIIMPNASILLKRNISCIATIKCTVANQRIKLPSSLGIKMMHINRQIKQHAVKHLSYCWQKIRSRNFRFRLQSCSSRNISILLCLEAANMKKTKGHHNYVKKCPYCNLSSCQWRTRRPLPLLLCCVAIFDHANPSRPSSICQSKYGEWIIVGKN